MEVDGPSPSNHSLPASTSAHVQHQAPMEQFSNDPTYVPTNVAVRIFCFVERDDLDNCVLVCKQWKWLIEYGEHSLRKRQLDAVWLSTNREFTITAYYGQRVKKFAFKKYFRDRDIKEAEVRKSYLLDKPYWLSHPTFPCSSSLLDTVTLNTEFEHFENFHQRRCNQSRPMLYNLRGSVYASKLFTPPLVFYERLEWLLRGCEVKSLVFCKFAFTDLFVEKFGEYLPQPFHVEHLMLHCCKVRTLTTYVFHSLIGEMILAQKYFIENIRFALPNHVSANLLRKPGIKSAKIVFIGRSLSRYNTDLAFNVDDDAFLGFVQSILEQERKLNSVDVPISVRRQFFGIAQSRVTPDAMKEYKKLYHRLMPKERESLYDHILFDDKRFLSEELEDIARNGIAQPGQQPAVWALAAP
ncbi:hypothetical protein DdX_02967 [Ditylenchus destructor]|uniref:F-box domain-containing protein n=1 Tax=Ditylenchus destructor TaxID=166010 RepID=A0AAD4RCM6_9BILA|nr:hypothetical protein DdX_02967 [Ditylenchus destructor]